MVGVRIQRDAIRVAKERGNARVPGSDTDAVLLTRCQYFHSPEIRRACAPRIQSNDQGPTEPPTPTTIHSHVTEGMVLKVQMPDDTGAWWTEDGSRFIGFLEPYTR